MASTDKPSGVIATGRFLRLTAANGWEYVERVRATAVVGIVAVTDDRRLLLVEQHRPPLGRAAIELPAGLVGDEHGRDKEDAAEAARRELLEETGYEAGEMVHLVTGPTSSGLTSETIALYHARHLRKVGQATGDGNEQITLHEVPLATVHQWLIEQGSQGKAIDLKIYTGLQLVTHGSER